MDAPQDPDVVDLDTQLERIDRPWTPVVVAELNGQHVRLAKLDGAFDLHRHPDEDELFLVLRGEVTIEREDRPPVVLRPGQLHVVPRGVEHRPVARAGSAVLLFEPASTRNTGDVVTDRTVESPERI